MPNPKSQLPIHLPRICVQSIIAGNDRKGVAQLERKRVLIFSAILIVVVTLLACDTGTFTAFLDTGTATPTRTPRPTFTPRATATPEDTPTPETTPTTAASPTLTPRPTLRPATKAPVVPTAVPKPQFEWKQNPAGNQGLCPQTDGTYEVKGRIYVSGQGYIGGIHVVALDKSGKVVAQMDSRPDTADDPLNIEWGVSCFEEKNKFNYQLDVSAGRNNQPFILRLTRSANDLTPISTDVRMEFPVTGGRFYIDWTK